MQLPPMTKIAEAKGFVLFRVDNGGVREGDFYMKYPGGEGQFIDTGYGREDEARLIADFLDDVNNE